MIETLRSYQATSAWLEHLSEIGPPPFRVTLHDPAALPHVLRELGVPDVDRAEIAATLPAPDRTPDAWWVLERAVHSLVRHMGMVEGPPWFPALPESVTERQPYFYVHVFLATLPHTRAYHQASGIPDHISWPTLADLGRSLSGSRTQLGCGGFDLGFWLMLHFRGVIYQLGRLQFERAKLGRRTGAALAAAGLPFRTGDPALAIHIPGQSGPLSPEACDAAIAQARAFFRRHFPAERYAVAVCNSWLLDPQLREYLPPESNLIRFQERFRLTYLPDPETEWLCRFVFGRSDIPLDQLPRRTTLERAIADHLRSGKPWHGGAGWFLLDAEP